MKLIACCWLVLALVNGQNDDQFNYRNTDGRDYGPNQWNKVSCDDLDQCLGWPEGWELGKGWELEKNQCKWCPATGNSCGQHLQSPINLHREVGDQSTVHHYECFDAHWMAYEEGGCDWYDMINNPWAPNRNAFQIRRHALQIVQPVVIDDKKGTGVLQCQAKGRKFPRLDYPKGFPRWWHLSHVEITTPSEHTQHGRSYDAEVTLAHFYQSDDGNNHNDMGKVVIFLEGVSGRSRWSYLDKLICQWREVEDQVRKDCNLPYTVPDYPGCRNGDAPSPSPPPKKPFSDPYPWIECDDVENTKRICKKTSCCEEDALFNNYCKSVYSTYKDTIGSICWWCCPGKMVDPAVAPDVSPINPPPPPPSPRPVNNNPDPSPLAPIPAPKGDFSCADYSFINFVDMCRIACKTPRCSSNVCHTFYETFGDDMEFACASCCNPARGVAPAPPIHPLIPKYDCRDVAPFGSPFRICKDTSCCNEKRNNNDYCKNKVYDVFGDDIYGICWYCCSTPMLAEGAPPFNYRRGMLRLSSNKNDTLPYDWEAQASAAVESQQDIIVDPVIDEVDDYGDMNVDEVSLELEEDGAWDDAGEYLQEVDPMRYIQNIELSEEDTRPNMSEEDFRAELEDYQERRIVEEDEFTNGDDHHRRLVNYDNVKWSDYAWMREVGTEYYFRYEGSQAVPPCYEKAHYRVMKDYIRVHPSQIAELERLIAKRIAPKHSEKRECQPDTAGRDRGDNRVGVNRPLQSRTGKHKTTFCECKDWKSKFGADRQWCEKSSDERFYDKPYNFNTGGF